jgi:hypothetical protein
MLFHLINIAYEWYNFWFSGSFFGKHIQAYGKPEREHIFFFQENLSFSIYTTHLASHLHCLHFIYVQTFCLQNQSILDSTLPTTCYATSKVDIFCKNRQHSLRADPDSGPVLGKYLLYEHTLLYFC